MIKRALISVSDKRGVAEFARALAKRKIEILSTGGTGEVLRRAGLKPKDVSAHTGFPELMDGRLKTLHPKIFGGLLLRRDKREDMKEAERNGIVPIDLVAVNLYPFESQNEIENIDIGGPALIRAAAKNYQWVTVVVDSEDFARISKEILDQGDTSLETRRELALKAFERTCRYDRAIADWFRKVLKKPEFLELHYEKVRTLRYGENPHQKAAFFRNPENHDANVTNARVLQGKELSFNNIVDANSALELVKEFEKPTAVFIKHNNPCGAASAENINEAFSMSYEVDPKSAFGSVVALNRPVTKKIVDFIRKRKLFIEVMIAPSFEEAAIVLLKEKPNMRLLETGRLRLDREKRDIKKVAGGVLVQMANTYTVKEKDLRAVTKKKPTALQVRAMLFASKVVKHVVSNAVVFAKSKGDRDEVTAIGAGQMSRVDSVWIAAHKGGERVKGSAMASDAFFPFPDAVEEAVKAGAVAIIQPGGSVRDSEVIAAADRLGIAMVFTGVRMFRH